MSGVIYPPPDEYLNIFNPINYFYDTGAGISISTADARYLKKAGDTATGIINFSNGLATADGTNGTPYGLSFINDTNSGFYRIGVDNLGISCGGVKQVDILTNLTEFTNPIRLPNGTGASPSINFSGATNLGLLNSAGRLGVVVSGATQYTFASDAMRLNLPIYAPNGSASVPSYSFGGNTGIFLSAANTIGFAMAGVNYISFSNSRAGFTIPIGCANGVQATPAIQWDNSSGLFRSASHDIRMSCNNSTKFGWNQTENTSYQNLNMNANNITSCPKVSNSTGNIILEMDATTGELQLTGGGLLSGTAGGSSGDHLRLKIGATYYKIALLND